MPSTGWIQSVRDRKIRRRTIPRGLFSKSAKEIAEGLKLAVLQDSRKGSRLALAMSILTFYINRAGRTLPLTRRRELEKDKTELRQQLKSGA